MKILLIEPDEYYHHQFQEKFSPIGEILKARDLEAALELMETAKPDIIVTELLLGQHTGYHVIAELSRFEPRPIIVHTQVDHFGDVQATLARGVSSYLIKGKNSLNELKTLIMSYV